MPSSIRYGLISGAAIAGANLLLQFGPTPHLPWAAVGTVSLGVWVLGVAGAGLLSATPRAGAAAAVIAASVDVARSAAIALISGPRIPPGAPPHEITSGMIVAAAVVEFALIAPVAACIGYAAVRVAKRAPNAALES